MSVEALSVALHHSKAKGTTKLVLVGIANHDGDGGAWPSVATLAKYANASERTVQYAIKQLETLGEIRRHFQDGGRASMWDHLRPNRYEILLRCPPRCDRSSAHFVSPSGPFDAVTGETDCTPTGEAGCTPTGEAGCTQTIPTEPSKKHPAYRRPAAMATDPQKNYIRHMQSVIGDWAAGEDPESMTCAEADGWIGAWMADYRSAGGGDGGSESDAAF